MHRNIRIHRVIRTPGVCLVQPAPVQSRVSWNRFSRAIFTQVCSISKVADSTASLCNLTHSVSGHHWEEFGFTFFIPSFLSDICPHWNFPVSQSSPLGEGLSRYKSQLSEPFSVCQRFQCLNHFCRPAPGYPQYALFVLEWRAQNWGWSSSSSAQHRWETTSLGLLATLLMQPRRLMDFCATWCEKTQNNLIKEVVLNSYFNR